LKRVIICLDGTWNTKTSRRSDTNVAKFSDLISAADAHGVRQIVHYVQGIASTPGERAQFLKGAVGYGVSNRIDKAFEHLSTDYEPGDDVFLFGFSRGAFEARRLSGFISLFGIAKSGTDFPFAKAWEIYRQSARKRDERAIAELRGLAHYPVRIKCVGVWDTVGNLGNPFFTTGLFGRRFSLPNTHPVEGLEVGLHALSVDELRGPFRPTLWTLPEGGALPPNQTIEQVWFPGTHCDVGGGFRETALSDIALRWMAERATATTGLAFNSEALAATTRPDPLGPQHGSAHGWIFFWSGLFPFVRLVKQTVEAIPAWRRRLIGTWRSGKLPKGEVSINESVHDSVTQRYGRRVIELAPVSSRSITYLPDNLAPVLPPPEAPPAAKPAGAGRRIKVYTVHGTFANEAEWDNWPDEEAKEEDARAFVHRLRLRLLEKGIAFNKEDHSQYEWSGGNSHEERRMGAIGLKKHIEADLTESYKEKGRDYYDGVFVVGHSHGGTISRLAMNLWDKDFDYYDPSDEAEFRHDDKCMTCMRARHGKVGPSHVPRPDGVITFGSPFVRFEPRRGGLLTAKIGVWVYRALFFIPLLILFGIWASNLVAPGVIDTTLSDLPDQVPTPEGKSLEGIAFSLLWPIALYLFVTRFLAFIIRKRTERWFGDGQTLFVVSMLLVAVKIALLALIIVYYVAYLGGGPPAVKRFLPFLVDPTFLGWVQVLVPAVLVWLLIVTLPGRFLEWIENKVVALKELLPRKFDPREDRPVPYLSYHTLGDEAGLHLRIFGALTWLVQTLGLTAACVLALGVILTPIIAIEAINHAAFDGSLLSTIGISALSSNPEHNRRFVELMDVLTFYPAAVWSGVFGVETNLMLGDAPNVRDLVSYVPAALAGAIWIVLLFLMPFILIAVGLVWLASMKLRGSGIVFGSESMAWTMANRITVTRRANDSSMLRFLFISPEAWRRQEIAHCYYYKSGRVIDDVAGFVSDWSRHKPSASWPLERWFSGVSRWLFVALFCLTIFAVSVPIAQELLAAANPAPSDGSAARAPGSGDTPEGRTTTAPSAQAPGGVECADEPVEVSSQLRGDLYDHKDVILRYEWEKQARAKYTDEWSVLDSAKDFTRTCSGGTCTISATPCKALAKPEAVIDPASKDGSKACLIASHSVTVQRNNDPPATSNAEQSQRWIEIQSLARPIWSKEVSDTFGAEWSNMDLADGRIACKQMPGETIETCTISGKPCKPQSGEAAASGGSASPEAGGGGAPTQVPSP